MKIQFFSKSNNDLNKLYTYVKGIYNTVCIKFFTY